MCGFWFLVFAAVGRRFSGRMNTCFLFAGFREPAPPPPSRKKKGKGERNRKKRQTVSSVKPVADVHEDAMWLLARMMARIIPMPGS